MPLKRVAVAADGRWPEVVDELVELGPRTNTHREGGRNHEREATRHSAEARCRGLGKRSEASTPPMT